MDELKLNFPSFEGNELIIREGNAPDHVDPVKLVSSGDIRTVGTFIKGRAIVSNLQTVNPSTTIVTVNKEAGTIYLETNPNDKFGSMVSGLLEISDELKPWGINRDQKFTQRQLIKMLKFNRIYFKDQATQQDLLKQYTAFKFQTATSGHVNNDERGNKSVAIEKNVETNIPKEFTLKMPIYKGEREIEFRVEICLEVTDGGATFWMESIELHELQQIEKEIIFARELDICKGLVVIFK